MGTRTKRHLTRCDGRLQSLTLQSELTDLASRLQATQFVAECRRQALNLPFGIDQIAQS